jgi:hypothetical protein
VVVTDSTRSVLEDSGLTGLTFQPVLKGRVVWLPWHEWDLNARRPHFRPPEGEPENYILEGTHSAEASEALGDLWELVPNSVDWIERKFERDQDEQVVRFRFLPERWDNADFFSIRPSAMPMCSSRAREWVQGRWPEWVSLRPLAMVE